MGFEIILKIVKNNPKVFPKVDVTGSRRQISSRRTAAGSTQLNHHSAPVFIGARP
jgi:hypothetical protein